MPFKAIGISTGIMIALKITAERIALSGLERPGASDGVGTLSTPRTPILGACGSAGAGRRDRLLLWCRPQAGRDRLDVCKTTVDFDLPQPARRVSRCSAGPEIGLVLDDAHHISEIC